MSTTTDTPRRGGATRYRRIRVGGRVLHVAIVRKADPHAGQTVDTTKGR